MGERRVCAVRGATTVDTDEPAAIRSATRALLAEIAARNALASSDIISVLFTMTGDLASEFPARAARELGWHDVPLLCAQEVPVPGALPRCIRVLLHVESERPREQMEHVYLNGARQLRPDLLRGEKDSCDAPSA
jgi:chorismate mutase